MQNKTISKILVALIMTSMLIAIMPAIPVGATTLTGITPVSGNVGTVVRVLGTIDTQGGSYSIYFDTDDDGNALNDGAIKTGNAPANSYEVNATFTIPPCLGSDSGNGHLVVLRDEQTLSSQSVSFAVITKRTITVPAHNLEGSVVPVNLTVTGGTIANQVNNFTVGITTPAGTMYKMANFSFSTDTLGSGSVTYNYPTDFSAGAHTNVTGTYTVTANRTLPGIITNLPGMPTFTVGLTDKLSYGRFETVNVQTAGWAINQVINVTIKNPSGTVVKSWLNQNVTTSGVLTGTWVIPWNATMGTYTIEAVNASGTNKAIPSVHTFEVGSAALTVTFTDQPSAAYQRTNTVSASFTVQYPDSSYYTNSSAVFSSITVSAYANTTMVGTVALTRANFDSATNKWTVSWKIPRNATLGNGYKFTLAKDSILDTNGNHGPTASVSSTTFIVNAAILTVNITAQPSANYTRVQSAMATMNITYPDKTYYTSADLGNITVRVYQGATIVANVSLAASNFNTTTNRWTIMWSSGFNATLATDYMFTVAIGGAKDVVNNSNTAAASTTTFELLKAILAVPMIGTNKASYSRGEFVQIYFDATYADGSPVVTGTSTVNVIAPDGFSATTLNPVHTTNGRWAVTWWASDAAQVGSYNITLAINGLVDAATPANMGPTTAARASFTILPADVTLDDLMAAINALENKIDAVEADTNGLGSTVTALQSSIVSIAELVADLQTQVDSLSATAATDADVAAVNTAVSAVSSDIAALETKVNALTTAVNNAASDADVAAVQAAVADLTADVAALETKLNTLTTTVNNAASSADLTGATDDLSGQIGGLNTMVIIAVVLALIAAIAAILAVYIIQRKIAG